MTKATYRKNILYYFLQLQKIRDYDGRMKAWEQEQESKGSPLEP